MFTKKFWITLSYFWPLPCIPPTKRHNILLFGKGIVPRLRESVIHLLEYLPSGNTQMTWRVLRKWACQVASLKEYKTKDGTVWTTRGQYFGIGSIRIRSEKEPENRRNEWNRKLGWRKKWNFTQRILQKHLVLGQNRWEGCIKAHYHHRILYNMNLSS